MILAQEGINVVVNILNVKLAREIASADVSNGKEIGRMFQLIFMKFKRKRIGILINNA